MIDLEAAKTKELAKILGAVAHENRIYILKSFKSGNGLSEIMAKAEISRSTLQNHLEMLSHAGLIERVAGKVPYKLTDDGEKILNKIKELEKEIIELRHDKETKLKADIFEETKKIKEPSAFASALNLGVKDLEKLLEKLRESKNK